MRPLMMKINLGAEELVSTGPCSLMSALISATCWIWASRGQDSPGQTEGMLMCSFKRELVIILLIRIGVQYVRRPE